MPKLRLLLAIAVLAALGYLAYRFPRTVEVETASAPAEEPSIAAIELPPLPEPELQTTTPPKSGGAQDIGNQSPLPNPPEVVKAIYLTAWSAGSPARLKAAIDLVKRTELNAVVIDVKDYSGYVSYRTGIPEVEASGAEAELRILRPNAMLKELHDNGVYAIARVTVFQDPILAKAHPEWALGDRETGGTWGDRKGLAWMDAAAQPVWDHNIAIAKNAVARGFDEINFDYIRFASDGDLERITYPFWDEKTPRFAVMRGFFRYLREQMPSARLSADLFGLSTIDPGDLGIGQLIENAYRYFDYVSPMIYPSHYSSGFIGFANPAEHPYEVVKYSMDFALARLVALANATSTLENGGGAITAKLRPWLQDFDLGATYDAEKVRGQIKGIEDAFAGSASTTGGMSRYAGWFLWDPANTYTEGALQPE